MFTDMVGFSALAQADEATALAVLDRHNRLLRPSFARFRGREVKTVGDAFLVEFESALDAVRCALEIQRALHEYNASATPDWTIRIRIGIHVGDVVETDGDVLGDAVNIASRIEPLADAGGICLTQQVFDQVQNKVDVPLVRLPPTALKNIRTALAVYRVGLPWEATVTPSPVPESTSGRQVAVLPLANISPDPGDGYFADGLTEELISVLSQIPGLSVIARTSVEPYKSAPRSIAQVGSDLGVDTVLEGSVRKAGNRIRISLQLIDVSTQRHIWSNSYNREIDDVFAVQSDVAERTAEALRITLAKSERTGLERRPTANVEAYDLYLRGLAAGNFPTEKSVHEAVRYFERATTLDPTFAEAYAAWANMYVVAAGDSLPMREVMASARTLAARALELDPESSDAHAALGNIALQFDHDWARAETEFRRAISLNPSNSVAHRFYALLLNAQERFEEAREVIRREIRLNPSGGGPSTLAWIEAESGDHEAGIEQAEAERDANPDADRPHIILGFLYLGAGRREDALREASTPLHGKDENDRFDHALLNALVGRPAAAREIVAEVERGEARSYTSATHLAMLYSALGNHDRALDLLEQDYREGDEVLWLWYRGVFFDPIRGNPRFIQLLHRYGVPVHRLRDWSPP
jgi:adenylate cyclase